MANVFETEEYNKFKDELLAAQLVNNSDAEENPNYTIGEIFSADKTGVDSDEFAQQHYLTKLLEMDEVREKAAKELNLAPYALENFAADRLNQEKYDNFIKYIQEYSVQTVSPKSPPQNIPRQDQDFGLLGEQRMDRRDPIPPRELTDQEKLVVSRGGDITTTYYGERGDSIADRYREWVTGVGDLSAESHSAIKSIFSLTNPTKEQVYELIKNEDPEAEVFYVNPTNKAEGVLVRSPATNGKKVPWRATLGTGLFSSLDETFRPLSENISGPFFTNTMEEITRNISPELLGGVFGGGLRYLFKKGSAKLDKTLAEKGPEGIIDAMELQTVKGQIIKGTGKYTALGAAVGIPTALTRYVMLQYGKASGVHPNLDSETMLEDAGLIGMMAALGTVGGDLLLRGIQNITRKFTGNNIPDEVVQRIRVRIEQLRAKDAAPEKALDMSKKEVDDVLREYAQNIGKEYSENKTLGELSGDVLLQDMEAQLLGIVSKSDPSRLAVEKMLLERGSTLQNFYEEMRNAAGKNGTLLPSYDQFKEYYATAAREAKEAEIVAKKTVVSEGSAVPVLEAPAPVSAITETVGEEIYDLTSTVADKRAALFLQRDSQFNEARDQLSEILDSAEVISIQTKQLDKFIGPIIKRFISGGSDAPIKSIDEAEAAGILRDIMPMKDGQSIIKNLIEGQQRSETGTFLAKPSFTLRDLINARINIDSLASSPNKALRNYAQELKQGFNDAINSLVAKNPELDARIFDATKNVTDVQENVINGSYLLSLVKSESYPEMSKAMLGGTPKNVRTLFDMLDVEDLKNSTPGFRTEEVRAAVLEQLRKEVLDPELSVSAQNKKFRQILKDREEQLQQIFPEENIKALKTFETFSRRAEITIQEAEARIAQLSKELRNNLNEDPFPIISQFLEADPKTLTETGALDEMRKLSALADKYPELRNSMQAVFSDFLRNSFEQPNYGRSGFERGELMFEESAFNLEKLTNFISGVGGGAFGTNQLGNNLSLLLGKEMGQNYARNLRILAQELNTTRNRQSRRGLIDDNLRTNIEEEDQGFINAIIRFFIPPLTKGGRRANLAVSKLRDNTQRHLLEILVDPVKTDALIKLRNRELTQRQVIEAIALIAANPSEDLGENQDAYNIVTGRMKDADEEELQRILKPLTTNMATGGSVSSALAQAEARNKQLRRGVS